MDANKFGLYFSQVIAASTDPNDKSVRTIDFLKRKRTTQIPLSTDVTFAIDERAAKFYLGFVQQKTNDTPGPSSPFLLGIFDLDFDPVDHLGYRRIRVRGGDCQYVVKPTPPVPCFLLGMDLCQLTGKLIGRFVLPGRLKASLALAEIERPNLNDSVLRAKFSAYRFETENSSRFLSPGGSMFSKLNHVLVDFYTFDKEFVKPQLEMLVFICSYNTGDLSLVRCLKFNPVDFTSQFFPEDMMKAFCTDRPSWALESQEIGRWMEMVGHIHKYVLFAFRTHILAIKWPRNWYTGQQLLVHWPASPTFENV